MRTKSFLSLLCGLSIAFAGCKKQSGTGNSQTSPTQSAAPGQNSETATFDACELIKKDEIEAVQGSPIKDTKSSGRTSAGFETALCFYNAAEFSRSVSFSVTRADPRSPSKRSLKEFWKETFGRYENQEKEKEKEQEGDKEKKESLREQKREHEEEGAAMKKITGIGDDAYWSGTRVGGALYVLKKETFIRVSVGGADNEETKIAKSKALAEKALGRL